MQNAKVAPQCWCGTSEFGVEIIRLFSCHLGSGCWRVARARCFMGNTTERHWQQMLMGKAGHLGTDLESANLEKISSKTAGQNRDRTDVGTVLRLL